MSTSNLRSRTNVVRIGDRLLGGDNPILIQTMADVKTSKTEEILAESADLAARGADLFRVSVLDEDDLLALSTIAKRSVLPIIADVHFSARFALGAIKADVAKLRLNPGNIPTAELETIVIAAKRKQIPIRIGVNSGSLDREHKADPHDLSTYFRLLDSYISVFKKLGYDDHLILALKSSDPLETQKLYRTAAEIYPYPLHVGITESGFGVQGMARSLVGLVPILSEGIGNTIRISLTDPPAEEIEACKALLAALRLRPEFPTLISCPTCGRTRVDVTSTVHRVKAFLAYVKKDVKVAIMGCPVNGPGEARDADFGLAGTKDAFLTFAHGIPGAILPEEEALAWLQEKVATFVPKGHIL